jgi:MFS family permease
MDAGVAFVIALLLTLFYHETFVPKEKPPIGVMLGDALQAVIQSPVATTIFLVSFVYNSAVFFSYTYLPVRIGEMVGERDAPAVIGLTQGVAGLATLIGSAVWGGLADRIGHRRLLMALMAAATVLWLPIYAMQDIAGLAAGWALFNAISPAVTSLMITIISLNIMTERRGAVLSMIYLPLNVAFVIAPLSASFVARNLEVRDVFLVSSVLAFLALLIFTLNLGRTRGEQNVAAGK